MKFHSEAERLADPQVSLIPKSMWNDVDLFNSHIPDRVINLMKAEESELIDMLQQSLRPEPGQTREYASEKSIWLAIALSHPNLSHELLLQISDILRIPNDSIREVFCVAAIWGNPVFIERLLTHYTNTGKLESELLGGYTRTRNSVFSSAAKHGQLAIMIRLKELMPDKVQSMIAGEVLPWRRMPGNHTRYEDYEYEAFLFAAENGYLDILEWLMELAPEKIQYMVAAHEYGPFRNAAKNGHLAVMKRLIGLAPDKAQEMIKIYSYQAFRDAAKNGHLSVIEHLFVLAPDKVQEIISAEHYEAVRSAAENGHLAVMQRLIELAGDKTREKWYGEAFLSACKGGHLAILEHLITLAPDAARGRSPRGYLCAVENGHEAIIERLFTIEPDKILVLSRGDNPLYHNYHFAFDKAITNRHLSVINYLLKYSQTFAWAESDEHEYVQQCVYPYVDTKLAALYAQKTQMKTDNPEEEFDITDAEEAKLLFYVARNLIRRNDPKLLAHLQLLLEIPKIKALAARGLGYLENTATLAHVEGSELLLTAISTGNEAAVELLLAIPRIKESEQSLTRIDGFSKSLIMATKHNYIAIINRLLNLPAILDRAESRGDDYVRPWIDAKLTALHAQKAQLQAEKPNVVFDITDTEEAQVLFYVARNLIRRNDPALLDHLQLLLEIPSVKILADKNNNELLRIASSTVNQPVAQLLLARVREFNLSNSALSCAKLIFIFNAMQPSVRAIDLSKNQFGRENAVELARVFSAIPREVSTLNLCANELEKYSLEQLRTLKDSLLGIKTVYLSYNEVNSMSEEKRIALKETFPNLSNTIFLNQNFQTLGVPGLKKPPITTGNPVQCTNLAKRLGFPSELPSLESQAAFFAKNKKVDITGLPERVQSIVKKS